MQADVKGIYYCHAFISVGSWKFCTVCTTGKKLKFWCRPWRQMEVIVLLHSFVPVALGGVSDLKSDRINKQACNRSNANHTR